MVRGLLVTLLVLFLFASPCVGAAGATLHSGSGERSTYVFALGEVCWEQSGDVLVTVVERVDDALIEVHWPSWRCEDADFAFRAERTSHGWVAVDGQVARGSFVLDPAAGEWVLDIRFGPCTTNTCAVGAVEHITGRFPHSTVVL